MTRTKKHKPGWKRRQAEAQDKVKLKSVPSPLDQPNTTKTPTNAMATDTKADPLDDSTRPSKRVKTTDSDANQPPRFAEQDLGDSKGQEMQTDSNLDLVDRVLPEQLRHLRAKCDFVTMSIVSSSRIQRKVHSLLDHMAKFSFADTKGKPGVVILRAKGDVAAKMISIVEIAKREIEKERGKWWQYSEKALSEWQKQHKDDVDRAIDEAQQAMMDPKPPNEPNSTEEEDDFEMMGQETRHNVIPLTEETETGKKIRAIPVMVTFMSRVPVAELKQAYGEQTNS